MHWTACRKIQDHPEELRHLIASQFSENHWKNTLIDSVLRIDRLSEGQTLTMN